MIKILNLKLVTLLKYQDIKRFFEKSDTPNWLEEHFVIKKAKIILQGTYVINGLNWADIGEAFCENNMQKTSQKEIRTEKVI